MSKKLTSRAEDYSKWYNELGNSVLASSSGKFSTGKAYGLAGRLQSLYAAETVIEIDEDEVCVSVGDY